MNELLAQFLIESRELIEQATADLLALEQVPDDRARLDGAFRGFHTLKGAAGIVELAAMARVMHVAEDLLAAVRAGEHPVTSDLIGDCLACLDQTADWLAAIEATGGVPSDADLMAGRLVAKLGSAGPATAPRPPEPVGEGRRHPSWIDRLLADCADAGRGRVALRYVPDADCFLRGEDPLTLVARLPGLLALNLQPAQPWPSLAELDPFACNLVVDALSSASRADIADHVRQLGDQVRIHALPPPASALPDRAMPVLKAQLALLDQAALEGLSGRVGSAGRVAANLMRHFGLADEADAVEAAGAASASAADPGVLRAALEKILNPAGAAPEAGGDPKTEEPGRPAASRALRVDAERIDAIVNLVSELTVVKNALGHAARVAQEDSDPRALAQVLKQQHALLDRLTSELQRSVLAIRVLPVRHVFQRFPRLVREMAGSLGKAARLVLEGEATEADKSVVDALFDPLLHVLRNAVDHGVETAEERAAAGKPETATIRLSAERQGEHVIVEILDDGRGIDVGEVRRVAQERNIVAGEALAALSEEEVIDLIFAPGFSTASTVTDVSGRGVGMDVVRSAIERLGGRVAVRSRVGEGTIVRFTVPFTVMVTRVMTVETAGQAFGVPLDVVVETLRLPRDRIVPIGAAEAFVLRGRTVPLINLARTLDLAPTAPASPVANTVVIEVDGQLGGLEVDRFGERLDVILKPMDGLLAGATGVAGTTLLGDGRVLIVLDLPELLL